MNAGNQRFHNYDLRSNIVSFVPSIDSAYYICGDFNIHIDVPGGDGGWKIPKSSWVM